MHSHDDGLSHEQAISTVDSHVTGAQHQLDDDHCCHASAHLIGLINRTINGLMPVNHMVESDYSVYQFSHSTSPPQRPPLS